METKQTVLCAICAEPIVPDESGYAACDSIWNSEHELYLACHNECKERRLKETGGNHVRNLYFREIGPLPEGSVRDTEDYHAITVNGHTKVTRG